jgi:predicted ribosome quality control (RQC) complex YloA/Tae2 family protein
MHNNYYFIRHLSKALQKKIVGMTLEVCFSQAKDELMLGFARPKEDFWVKCSLTSQLNMLSFPEDFVRAKQNSVDIFKEIIEKEVIAVRQFENERAFSIQFKEDWELIFKLYGNRSNIILCQFGKPIKLFHQRLPEDMDLSIHQLDRKLNQNWESFQTHGLKIFPTFGSEIKSFLKQEGYEKLNLSEQWQLIQILLQEMDKGEFYICETSQGVELLLFTNGDVLFETNDAISASNEFYYRFSKTFFLDKEKNAAIKMLSKKEEQSRQYIEKSGAKLVEIEHGVKNEEIANILMANLHQIPPRSKQITLFDFYRNKDIIIKLNELLNPQKNAENYYRKAKNQKIEVENLQHNILQKKKDLEAYQWHLLQIEEIDNLKDLRKYLKENKLQSSGEQEVAFPFRRFFYKGFEILIGRNSANNDLLTQKYAYKEDLWLHARDVGGSHVLIKYQSGKDFPKDVIEKAAEMAAYYSQRRTETLCPVIVTPKKFVRKTKDLAVGEVIVDKEEVILVKPAPFE